MFGAINNAETKKEAQPVETKKESQAAETKKESQAAETKAPLTDEQKKEARKLSAQKMLEHKKAAIKTLVEFAQRMNADGKDAAVKEAADYLSGVRQSSGSKENKVSILDEIFKDSKTVKAIDIFMNFEKGRAEMITICKRAEKKGIIVEYNEADKTYTRK